MEKVMALAGKGSGIHLYLPESFEWLLLSSDIFKDKDLAHMLENTADYAASEIYGSWECFFTRVLEEITQGTYLAYAEETLNRAYLQGNIPEKVLREMEGITFSKSE